MPALQEKHENEQHDIPPAFCLDVKVHDLLTIGVQSNITILKSHN